MSRGERRPNAWPNCFKVGELGLPCFSVSPFPPSVILGVTV